VLDVAVGVWVMSGASGNSLVGFEWIVESNSGLRAIAARGFELDEWVDGVGGAAEAGWGVVEAAWVPPKVRAEYLGWVA
jgi:hypothetical protein